ncbi:tRNA pseudouridine synthase C [Mannheimia haemolytica]|nr:tRNA pseudouridine synthase C [Mannheimia haemolytica]
MTLDILYQDNSLIAINKPAGVLVHRSWLDKHETVFAMQTLRDQNRATRFSDSPP